MNTPLVVCCYNNESKIWRYETYIYIYNYKNIIIYFPPIKKIPNFFIPNSINRYFFYILGNNI